MGGGHGSMMDMMHMMMGERGGGMGMMSAMAGHVEGRLAFLKTELKITDTQQPLWNKFADALRDNAKTMTQVMQGRMSPGKSVHNPSGKARATREFPDRSAQCSAQPEGGRRPALRCAQPRTEKDRG